MNMNIVLRDILQGRNFPDAGTSLFKIAEDAIKRGENVVVDMKNIESVPTMFMNTSFGNLIVAYGIDKTKKLFVFNNITRSQFYRIQKYFDDFQNIILKQQ